MLKGLIMLKNYIANLSKSILFYSNISLFSVQGISFYFNFLTNSADSNTVSFTESHYPGAEAKAGSGSKQQTKQTTLG